MSKSLDDLDPATRIRVQAVMAAMAEYGYPLLIIRTYDTLAKQAKLYAQGRTTPGKIVTKIKRGWHNIRKNGKPAARAVDFAFKKQRRFPGRGNWSMDWPWARLRKIGAACDLKKTLRWDYGHLVDDRGEKFSEAWRKSDQA
jgi:peptidoglycan L-alanyl-D-glutamate endopeptidase CwlK